MRISCPNAVDRSWLESRLLCPSQSSGNPSIRPSNCISAGCRPSRIDALFDIEREINDGDPAARLAARQRLSAPLVEGLEGWLRSERALLSKHAKVARAIDYLLSPDHWPGFTRFLEDGRVCLTNNCAERSLRGVAPGRKSWLFAGSGRGGQRAAFMHSLIGSAKLNGIDPQAWLANVIVRISDMPVSRLPKLLPWAWSTPALHVKAA